MRELLGPPLSFTALSQTSLCENHTKRTGTTSTLLSLFTLAFRSPSSVVPASLVPGNF